MKKCTYISIMQYIISHQFLQDERHISVHTHARVHNIFRPSKHEYMPELPYYMGYTSSTYEIIS
jgi:hypothetical protein